MIGWGIGLGNSCMGEWVTCEIRIGPEGKVWGLSVYVKTVYPGATGRTTASCMNQLNQGVPPWYIDPTFNLLVGGTG